MRNILIIDDEWPSEYSGKWVRIFNLFKKFKIEHKLHFLYIGNKPEKNLYLIKDIFQSIDLIYFHADRGTFLGRIINLFLLKPGDYARWRYKNKLRIVQKQIKNILADRKIDLIQVFSYYSAEYVSDFKEISKIWDVADSLYLTLKRKIDLKKLGFGQKIYARKLYNFEHEMIKKFDRTIYVSEGDAAIHDCLKEKISIIPNGVDLDYFRPNETVEEYPSLIFTGHMSFNPNVQAVLFFEREVFPFVKKNFPKIKFYVVGAEPNKEILELNGKAGVVVTGFVDDVRPYLSKATIFISPMVNGSGIKNKILQAMAMGKPVVSTALGAEALEYRKGEDLMIADEPDIFARVLKNLLEDREKRNILGINGRRLVEEKYSWDKAIEKYRLLFQGLKDFKK